jgi:hypothetical protein
MPKVGSECYTYFSKASVRDSRRPFQARPSETLKIRCVALIFYTFESKFPLFSMVFLGYLVLVRKLTIIHYFFS